MPIRLSRVWTTSLLMLGIGVLPPVIPRAAAQPAKLLLSAVCVQTNDQEYFAIYNPNNTPVDLSNYYVTDSIHFPSNTNYAYLVNPASGTPGGAGNFNDFNIRFPAGATIAAHDTIAVSHRGTVAFFRAYNRKPDYEVVLGGNDDPQVPNMRAAFDGSIHTDPTLTNSGESLVLYYWDGQSDLVTDIDYVVWGPVESPTTPGTANSFVLDKTGISVDGPDPDSTPTAYKADTPRLQQSTASAGPHNPGEAFRRQDFNEGTQHTTGGNGVGGRDETSENLATTFAVGPGTPPFNDIAPPAQQLTARLNGPYTGTVDVAISMSGSASTPTTGETISAYNWNFGDGTNGTGVTTTHAYGNPGTFTVTLTVHGSGGTTNSATTTATVTSGGGPASPAKKLLLQAVCVTGTPQEYVSIYNPNNEAVDLANYYISDAIHTPETSYIWIANRNNTTQVAGGGTFFDFHVRFPAGATIAAHDTIAVSHVGAPNFESSYGRKPAFEVAYPSANDPTVTDMRPAFPGSVPSVPDSATLSNGGEVVMLYYWDGQTDLVTDVDYMVWGGAAGTTFFNDKTGKCVDGPDADATCTSYKPDTPIASQKPFPVAAGQSAHANGKALRREDFTEGTQTSSGGNGVDGRDETSENLNQTWSNDKDAVPPFVKAAQPSQLTARPGGPYTGAPNVPVQFNGSGSTAPTGQTISNYAWTFGDGGSGTGANPTHTYTAGGSFTVTLTVTGSGGGTNSASTTATIAQPGVLTSVPGGPYTGTVGTAVSFDGSHSVPTSAGPITAFAWSFGDGASGTGSTTTHTYATAGTFTVTLTVTGTGGGTASASTTATISAGNVPTGALQVKARTFLPTRHESFPITVDNTELKGQNVTLRIYDLDGRELKILQDGDMGNIKKTFTWDGHDDELMIVPAGTYICHLEIRDDKGHHHNFTAPIVVARSLERN